jgi:hypothetical protein
MADLISTSGNTIKIAKETTFGTAVTPVEALKHNGVDVTLNNNFVDSGAFTGSRATNGSYYVGRTGSISYPYEADSRNLGWLLGAFFGSDTVTPASTGAHEHSFSMASTLPSFTFETSLGGTYHYTNKGVKCNNLSMEVSPKSIVTGSADFVFIDQVTQGSPTALTPASTKPFIFNDSLTGSVKFDTVTCGEVKSLSLKGANNLSLEDYRMGASGKLGSIPAGKHSFGGSMTLAYNGSSTFLESYVAGATEFDLAVIIDSGIAVGLSDTLKFTVHIPTARLSNLKVDSSGDFVMLNIDFASIGSGAEVILVNDRATAYV